MALNAALKKTMDDGMTGKSRVEHLGFGGKEVFDVLFCCQLFCQRYFELVEVKIPQETNAFHLVRLNHRIFSLPIRKSRGVC